VRSKQEAKMKACVLALILTVAVTASADPVPAQGSYKPIGGGMVNTTCPNFDNTPLYKMPYWTVRVVSRDTINLRQSVNPYFTTAEPRFGYFPMKGLGYGTFEGTGYITHTINGAYGACTMKNEITAKLNAFGSSKGVLLDATIKTTYLNPSFETFICQRYGVIECQTKSSYDLEFDGDNGT
jgi:hypothetical protein